MKRLEVIAFCLLAAVLVCSLLAVNWMSSSRPAASVQWMLLSNQIHEVERMLETGALDPNFMFEDGDTPLTTIAGQMPKISNGEMIELLKRYGADLDKKNRFGQPAILLAVGTGHHSVAKRLMNLGANVSATDERGYTALYSVGYSDKDEAFRLVVSLIHSGLDPQHVASDGTTALEHLEKDELLVWLAHRLRKELNLP
jgi:hypothetical protein